MRPGLRPQNVPLAPPIAPPIAPSHERRSPLWPLAFAQLTPGALCVLLFLEGGLS